MNILLIQASPRQNGITSSILAEIRKNISPGHTVDACNISKMRIRPCAGCLKCRPDKDCVLPRDDAHELSGKIKNSDVIIIGFPTYWGNIPGSLKVFFDRSVSTFEYAEAKAVMKPPKPLLKGKKAVIITASASPFPYNRLSSQSGGAVRSLKTILKAGGIKIVNIMNIPNSYKFDAKKDRYLKKARDIALSFGDN